MTRKQSWINRAGISTLTLWALVGCTGCNPFAHYQHRHTGLDFLGERHVTYYHYPNGNWFVPNQQKHHQPVITEPPFHGFAATCWTRWPEPWQPCPPPGFCPSVPGQEFPEGPHEVIPLPAHGQRMPATAPQLAQAQPPAPQLDKTAPTATMPPPAVVKQAAPQIAFQGKFGFSSPDEEISTSAVAIELPMHESRSESKRR